jgi:hypothetical protein
VPGDLPDGRAEVRQRARPLERGVEILKTKRVFVLKEEVGTLPRFFYYFDERYPRALDPEALAIGEQLKREEGERRDGAGAGRAGMGRDRDGG